MLVADAPAFVVNRLLIRLMSAITQAVDEGTPVAVADAALRPLGLPMPPFVLLQLVGPAIVLHVTETLHAAFRDRFPSRTNLRALVAAQAAGPLRLDRRRPAVRVGGDRGADDTSAIEPSTAAEVRTRALEALAEEAGLLLAEGVVAAPMDIDLCMILGAGCAVRLWAAITPYLDREGVSERVLGRRFLPQGVASLP